MLYEKMIESENSDIVREHWSSYRRDMTDYVRERVEDYYRRKHLLENGKIRDQKFSLESYLKACGKKPVLAIWGAGRCNDLSILELAPFSKLVLIDRDISLIEAAKARYGFSDTECVCINLPFWEIYEEEERYFETLLVHADDVHLSQYLKQLFDSLQADIPNYETFEDAFDFSVCFGLASQLQARFAGLLYGYEKNIEDFPMVQNMLRKMNQEAEIRLLNAILMTTKNAFFCANEMCARIPAEEEILWKYAHNWSEDWEEALLSMQNKTASNLCNVEGSREFLQAIEHETKQGGLKILHRCGMVWPFSEEKYYFMDVFMSEIINKKNK